MWSICVVYKNRKPTTDKNTGIATIHCVNVVIQNIIGAAFLFAGSVAAIVIILGGIKYIRSQGNPEGIKSAQQTITYGLIGLVIVIFAFGIVSFIESVAGTTKSCILNGLGICI